MKPQNIPKEDWDTLIILDACRYDYFKKVYDEYLSGDLTKRRSKGSSTPEWLAKTFPDYYDVTYFSANPYVNSAGLPLKEWSLTYPWSWSVWKATKHFSRIVDVWKFGWDENFGTVLPEVMNNAVLDQEIEKTIIHYLQPHVPYLSLSPDFSQKAAIRETPLGKRHENGGFLSGILSYYNRRFHPLAVKKLGRELWWNMKTILRLPPHTPIEIFWREGRIEELLDHYQRNLREVLEAVSNLVDSLEGKTVVTTDHGEAFGENGTWEHPIETHIPVLVEVPWLEIS